MELMAKQGFKHTEVGLIPEDWEIVKFNEIGDAIIGLTYSPKDVNSSGKLVHRSSNIQSNKLAYYDNVYVTCDVPEKLILKKNDILICVRNGSRNLIGKSAIIEGKSIGETFGAFMSVFRPNGYAPLIYQCFISDIVQSQINASLGATINQITNKTLNSFLTPLPPTLTEQKAIATALSDVDELITNLDKIIAKKKDIKKGAMQQLLTPPNKGGKRLPGFSGDWEETKIEDFCYISKGQLITSSTLVAGTIPVIAGGKKPAYYHNAANRKGKTITISASGASAGYVAYHDYPIFASDCSTIEEDNSYSIEFVYYLLMQMQSMIYFKQTGGAQPHIHASDLNPIEVIVPNKQEQESISKVLRDMELEITQLESKKEKYQAIKQGMMQELLTGKTRLI
jgi:type I restriction enzyme S subunit